MALDNTELSIVLNELNEREVTDTVNRARILLNVLPKEKSDINARGVNLISKVNQNYSMHWFGEGGTYPAGGNSARVKMTVNYARLAISSRMTRDTLENGAKTAIINAIAEEISDNTGTALQELSQEAYGDGSGAKAVVASVSGTTVTFRSATYDVSPDEASTFSSNYANAYGTALLLKNGVYNFVSGDASFDRDTTGATQTRAVGTLLQDGSSGTSYTMTSITDENEAVFDAVPANTWTLTDGDIVVLKGSYNISIKGLEYHISSGTGTYQNVSRNTYSNFRCYTLNAGGAALTVAMLYKLIQQAKYLRSMDVTDENYIILSSPAQVHAYLLLSDVSGSVNASGVPQGDTALNAMPNAQKLDFGFTMYSFAGLRWVEDPHCPDRNIYILLPSKFKWYEFKPLGAVPLGGDSGFAPVPAFNSSGVGAYTDNAVYTMTWKGNLGCKDPQLAGMKISNLQTEGLARLGNGFSLS